jgi:hypothetical protein
MAVLLREVNMTSDQYMYRVNEAGGIEINKKSTDAESPPPTPRIYMGILPEGES